MNPSITANTSTSTNASGGVEWYRVSPSEVEQRLETGAATGLTSSAVEAHLAQYGPNQLAEQAKEPGWKAFQRQYSDLMQIVLVGAAVVNQLVSGDTGTTLVLL